MAPRSCDRLGQATTQQLAREGELARVRGRASTAVRAIALRHPGERVVLACHAGVVESAILRFLPISKDVVRLKLHTPRLDDSL